MENLAELASRLFFWAVMIFSTGLIIISMTGCAPQQGPKGDTGAIGSQGEVGPVGAPGSPGQNGSNGSPGTVVTPVQLCPGTPSYPSTFTEIGLCISDNLYAVYSANGGFLTLLLPGEYQSNAINSRCNLAVSAHCKVSY